VLPYIVAYLMSQRVRQDGTSYYVLRGFFITKARTNACVPPGSSSAVSLPSGVPSPHHPYPIFPSLFLQLIMCGLLAYCEHHAAGMILLFTALHGGFATASNQFIPMSLSDVIDKDMVDHDRPRRLATLHFGLNALVRRRESPHPQHRTRNSRVV